MNFIKRNEFKLKEMKNILYASQCDFFYTFAFAHTTHSSILCSIVKKYF